jgi:hypothetical protein
VATHLRIEDLLSSAFTLCFFSLSFPFSEKDQLSALPVVGAPRRDSDHLGRHLLDTFDDDPASPARPPRTGQLGRERRGHLPSRPVLIGRILGCPLGGEVNLRIKYSITRVHISLRLLLDNYVDVLTRVTLGKRLLHV